MNKPSEIFEGPNSSLHQAFDKATKGKTINEVVEEFNDIICREWGEHSSIYEALKNRYSDWLRITLTTLLEQERKAERQEWLSGNCCSLCGGSNLDSKGLSNVCGKCYEEQ